MADVQPENGTVRIENKLYTAALLELSPAEFKVWAGIIRVTWGVKGRKSAPVTYRKLAEKIGMQERNTIRVCGILEARNVIICIRERGKATTIGPQKDYDQWLHTCKELHPCTDMHNTRAKNCIPHVQEIAPPTMYSHVLQPCITANTCTYPAILDHYQRLFYPSAGRPNPRQKEHGRKLMAKLVDEWDETKAIAYLAAWHDHRWDEWRKEHPGEEHAPGILWFEKPLMAYFNGGALPHGKAHSGQGKGGAGYGRPRSVRI